MQMPQGPSPFMGMMMGGAPQGGPPGYSPGATIWREVMRGMSTAKNPLAVLAPDNAGKFFSPEVIGYLAPEYQKQKGKK